MTKEVQFCVYKARMTELIKSHKNPVHTSHTTFPEVPIYENLVFV